MTDLWRHSAIDLATLIAKREVSASDVIEAHLDRIDAVNPRLNAIVRLLADDARAAARLADQVTARGAALGPLHGVPFTIKENIDMAGHPTTQGVPALAGAIASRDAPIVARMRAAGAIPIGRTNLPDFAMRVHTDSSLHGLTRNPWSFHHTAGGSSGGEAAALASGMSPIGLGTDIGGSLRSPANACGIATIRPSAGRVPDASQIPGAQRLVAAQMMNSNGPMARSIADVRLGLQVIMGADRLDPWSLDMPFSGPPLRAPIKVALVATPPGGNVDPAVAETARKAATYLADAGYEVVEISPPRFEETYDLWLRFIMAELRVVAGEMYPAMGSDGLAFLNALDAVAPPLADAAAMSHLLVQRDLIAQDWSAFLDDYPLILSPVWTQLHWTHGYDVATPEQAVDIMYRARAAVMANMMGLPSVCVPAGCDGATGLPIGVLLTGRRMRDDLCLDAAQVIETRAGVHTPIDPRW